jgi:hypothetical protein
VDLADLVVGTVKILGSIIAPIGGVVGVIWVIRQWISRPSRTSEAVTQATQDLRQTVADLRLSLAEERAARSLEHGRRLQAEADRDQFRRVCEKHGFNPWEWTDRPEGGERDD